MYVFVVKQILEHASAYGDVDTEMDIDKSTDTDTDTDTDPFVNSDS